MRAKRCLAVCLAGLSLFANSCVFPTGRRTSASNEAQRLDPNGTPVETIQKEEVYTRWCYLVGSDGPEFAKWWFSKLRYNLIDQSNNFHRLGFLTTKEQYEACFKFIPISSGRWISIGRKSGEPYNEDTWNLRICVFNRQGLLFATNVIGCHYKHPPAFANSRQPAEWRPLRSDIQLYESNYRFDPKNEDVVFRTYNGDFDFSASDRKLIKISSE